MEENNNKILIYNNIMYKKPAKDRFYQIPERAILYAFKILSAQALRLYIVFAGQKNGFSATKELYCNRANIEVDDYEYYMQELIENHFVIVYKNNTYMLIQ